MKREKSEWKKGNRRGSLEQSERRGENETRIQKYQRASRFLAPVSASRLIVDGTLKLPPRESYSVPSGSQPLRINLGQLSINGSRLIIRDSSFRRAPGLKCARGIIQSLFDNELRVIWVLYP